MSSRPPRVIIRKLHGVWRVLLMVYVAGQWFPWSWALCDSWPEAQQAATALWVQRP